MSSVKNNEKFDLCKDAFCDYLEYERKYSMHTISSYDNDICEFLEFLNSSNIYFLDVSYDDIREFCNYLECKNIKATSVSRMLSSLRSFYKYLARNGYIKTNPFMLVKAPKKEKKLPKFLYYNELEELFKIPDLTTVLGLRDRLVLELLYATGVRVSELDNIKINDINLDERTIKVLGKGNKERFVFFGDYAYEILELYLPRRCELLRDDNNYLFLNNHGNRLTTNGIRYIIDNIIRKSSLNTHVSPHMIRHSFATHLLNEGCDLLSVQELLGHESIKATQIYTHVTNDRLKEIYLKAHPRERMGNEGE